MPGNTRPIGGNSAQRLLGSDQVGSENEVGVLGRQGKCSNSLIFIFLRKELVTFEI